MKGRQKMNTMKGRQKMKTMLKSLLLAGCVMAPAYAFADSVYLTSLNFAGSGCSPADAAGMLLPEFSPKPDRFVVSFGALIAVQDGQDPKVHFTDRRKACTITAGFHIPKGLQISIAKVEYEGTAFLPKGVYGRQKSSYEFPLVSNEVTARTFLSGPYFDVEWDEHGNKVLFPKEYTRLDKLIILAWSRCGIDDALEIETEVALAGSTYPKATIGLDNVDGEVKSLTTQTYYLETRTCH